MNERRASAASAQLLSSNTFLVSGGYNENATLLKTNEVFDGLTWTEGSVADLPTELSQHCIVAIDGSTLFLSGGTSQAEDFSRNEFYESLFWPESFPNKKSKYLAQSFSQNVNTMRDIFLD
jgi:hypothetical protein